MSVTTSAGDLHKAPFQSCSAREDDRGRNDGDTDRQTDRVTDTSVGEMRGTRRISGGGERRERIKQQSRLSIKNTAALRGYRNKK